MTTALNIENLVKVYHSGVSALEGISLKVEQGDFFALLGPNGAGKSTAIGIISSLVNKTSGKVFIFDQDIDVDFSAAKRLIGLVPQEFNFNMFEPVIEIVTNQAGYYGMDRRQAYKAAEFYLQQLGLWEKRREVARELSGGMKRRLMIARALVHQPKLLILDEPTAGVDIEIRRSMWEFMKKINASGTTIILTTHYLEEAESLCRHIAIINRGQLIENTSMRHLLNKLHRETFVLYLKEPTDKFASLSKYSVCQLDKTTLEVTLPRETSLNIFFQNCSDAGIEILSMKNKSNRLEELFIDLVGAPQGSTA